MQNVGLTLKHFASFGNLGPINPGCFGIPELQVLCPYTHKLPKAQLMFSASLLLIYARLLSLLAMYHLQIDKGLEETVNAEYQAHLSILLFPVRSYSLTLGRLVRLSSTFKQMHFPFHLSFSSSQREC